MRSVFAVKDGPTQLFIDVTWHSTLAFAVRVLGLSRETMLVWAADVAADVIDTEWRRCAFLSAADWVHVAQRILAPGFADGDVPAHGACSYHLDVVPGEPTQRRLSWAFLSTLAEGEEVEVVTAAGIFCECKFCGRMYKLTFQEKEQKSATEEAATATRHAIDDLVVHAMSAVHLVDDVARERGERMVAVLNEKKEAVVMLQQRCDVALPPDLMESDVDDDMYAAETDSNDSEFCDNFSVPLDLATTEYPWPAVKEAALAPSNVHDNVTERRSPIRASAPPPAKRRRVIVEEEII